MEYAISHLVGLFGVLRIISQLVHCAVYLENDSVCSCELQKNVWLPK